MIWKWIKSISQFFVSVDVDSKWRLRGSLIYLLLSVRMKLLMNWTLSCFTKVQKDIKNRYFKPNQRKIKKKKRSLRKYGFLSKRLQHLEQNPTKWSKERNGFQWFGIKIFSILKIKKQVLSINNLNWNIYICCPCWSLVPKCKKKSSKYIPSKKTPKQFLYIRSFSFPKQKQSQISKPTT